MARALDVDPLRGLSDAEAARRLARDGPNALRAPERRSVLSIVLAQLKSIIAALLVVAAVVSFAFGHALEGAAVLAVVILNTAIGALTEMRAVRSMEALRALGEVETTVRRGGEVTRIGAEELVRGDVLLLESGDRVTADARLVEASRLLVDESALTGESVGVDKSTAPAPDDAPLAERVGMLFKGTAVTRGAAEAIVVATGSHTELGRIAALVEEVEDEQTPLEKRLERLGRQLLWVSLVFAGLVAVSGWTAGLELFVIVETAIALAVATVPEGLPIVATLALARGMLRMADQNALVERLSAVETLGSTSLILTDKTGTLTENRMVARRVVLPDGARSLEGGAPDPALRRALEVAALCNDAARTDEGPVGDPMEVALLDAAAEHGLARDDLLDDRPEVRQEAFDPAVKMMATVHEEGDGFLVAVKGAPEAVIGACVDADGTPIDEAARAWWLGEAEALGRDGHRVLGLAARHVDSPDAPVYEGLSLVGLIALLDPPREDVKDAVRRIRSAGLRLVMATGDHPSTGHFVAEAVGLDEDLEVVEGRALKTMDHGTLRRAAVIARASPEDKLRLLSLHQDAGEVVAMLGDGVNDAPALEKADIGVAMGQRGTQVAREAADMVLLDDRLGTVVVAIEQGRVIFENIRKFAIYLLACNLSEILVIGIASAVRLPLPLLPLQILFLNLVTDVFPALALSGGEATDRVMERPPRPRAESILGRAQWRTVALHGALLTATVLGAYGVALGPLGFETSRAVTVSFLAIAFAQLVEVFNVADPRGSVISNEVTRNPAVWAAIVLCSVLLLGAVYMPGAPQVLGTVDPGLDGWLLVAGASFAPLVAVQGWRLLRRAISPARTRA